VNQGHAPQIPGFVYKRDLGAGGFADVYLYERLSPRRDVAVKVLRAADMSDRLVRRFTAEADTMAALGDHPNIVQVFGSGVSADARPYIEMAYYPGKSLADTLKTRGQFAVADVLRVGVQLSSAIETAHRAGLLHRDIKPANVLIDQYGDPAITDFGIASRLHDDDDDSSLSVPWAPPEAMFSTSPVDVRSDVYSLGAMLWNLLVGRAPYEIPGGDNRPSAMMIRTRDLSLPTTGRGDVPQSLERLLAQTMNKNPSLRPQSAAILARSLNAVEAELRFAPTSFKVAIDFE
jgi:serine/threonine protein kinase